MQKELTSNYGITLKEAGLLVNQGGIAYIPYEKETVSPKQAIDLIHQANGLAILAHPGEIMKRTEGVFTERAFYNRIKDIIDFGIDGIEVFSPSHNEEQTDAFFDIVRQKGLLITGGSDFHGLAQAPQRPIAQSGIGRKLFDKFLARIGN